MSTSKPISTISYNSEAFLRSRLDAWYDQHLIQCFMYIKHKGEDGDKDHIHLRIEPNKRLDPMDLTLMLKEFTPDNEKPLGCRPWRPSKEEDWFLYAIHDKQYLKIKDSESKDGKIQYEAKDIITSEGYDVECALLRARQSMNNHTACIVKQIKEGRRVVDLIEEGKDVFRVQAVLKTLYETDYESLAAKYKDLYTWTQKLENAMREQALQVEEENGKLKIKCYNIRKFYGD